MIPCRSGVGGSSSSSSFRSFMQCSGAQSPVHGDTGGVRAAGLFAAVAAIWPKSFRSKTPGTCLTTLTRGSNFRSSRPSLEREEHDFVRTVRFEIAVPRIIRLLGYDRLPRQDVKLNRRNIYARDHSIVPVLRQEVFDPGTVAGSRDSAVARGQDDVGQSGVRLRVLQRQEGGPHAAAGAHAPAQACR